MRVAPSHACTGLYYYLERPVYIPLSIFFYIVYDPLIFYPLYALDPFMYPLYLPCISSAP